MRLKYHSKLFLAFIVSCSSIYKFRFHDCPIMKIGIGIIKIELKASILTRKSIKIEDMCFFVNQKHWLRFNGVFS